MYIVVVVFTEEIEFSKILISSKLKKKVTLEMF